MTTSGEGDGPIDPPTPEDATAPTQSVTWRSPGLWIVIGIAVLTLVLAVFI
jgi:hypothetical protein